MTQQPAGSLVLFDIDGTIMRGAGALHKESLAEGIRSVIGLTTTLDGIPTAGMLDRDLIALMLRTKGQSERRYRTRMREIVTACEEYYVAHSANDLTPFLCRGVPDVLEALKSRGAVLGLVTGNLSAIGWRKIEMSGLRHYFAGWRFCRGRANASTLGATRRVARAASRPDQQA